MSSKSTPNDPTKKPVSVIAKDSENEPLADSSLLRLLTNAFEPDDIDPEKHDEILEKALGIGFSNALPLETDIGKISLEERQQAELLSLALEGRGSHPLAELASSLKVAFSPDPLEQLSVERAIKGAFSRDKIKSLVPHHPVSNSRRKRVTTGAGVGLALAATFAFLWYPRSNQSDEGAVVNTQEYTQSRSLAPLFGKEFSQGNSTERMDRIVMARSRDLRHNRYLKWRVR